MKHQTLREQIDTITRVAEEMTPSSESMQWLRERIFFDLTVAELALRDKDAEEAQRSIEVARDGLNRLYAERDMAAA